MKEKNPHESEDWARRLSPAPPSARGLASLASVFCHDERKLPPGGPYIASMTNEPLSDDILRREIKSRIRLAVVEGESLRREFLRVLSEALGRTLWYHPSKVPHESMRFINLRALMARYHLTMEQLVEVMIEVHRLRHRRFLPNSTQWFSPDALLRFEEVSAILFPEAGSYEAAEARLYQIASSIDEAPLPANPARMTQVYRDRLRELNKKIARAGLRFRRPFRGNPWRSL